MSSKNNDQKRLLPVHPNIMKFRENFEYIKLLFKEAVLDEKADPVEQYLNASRIEGSCYIPEEMVRVVLKNRFDILRIWMLSGNPIFYDVAMKNLAVSIDDQIVFDNNKIYTEDGKVDNEKIKGFVNGRVVTETIFYDNIAYLFQVIDIPENNGEGSKEDPSDIPNN